jgi:hypothetical protein
MKPRRPERSVLPANAGSLQVSQLNSLPQVGQYGSSGGSQGVGGASSSSIGVPSGGHRLPQTGFVLILFCLNHF